MTETRRSPQPDDDENDEIPQEVLDAWPNCIVPDCGFKSCRSLNSTKCYAHTTGDFSHVKEYDLGEG